MSSASSSKVTCLHYVDVAQISEVLDPGLYLLPKPDRAGPEVPAGVPEEEVQARIAAACVAERLSTEQRLQQELARAQEALREGVVASVRSFAEERSCYFSRVESEVVELTLAIARKILQREAEVDPLLLAGLVRLALDGMQSGPAVRLRVQPDQVAGWQHQFLPAVSRQRVEVVADASLAAHECILETELGSARLSYETQLKEIERGFRDLLGMHPNRPQWRSDRTPGGGAEAST